MKDTILISIHPNYVNDIIRGTKRYEYRTKLPRNKINKFIIYATSPVKKIVCEVEVLDTLSLSPEEMWNLTKYESGFKVNEEKEEFLNYFKKRKTIHSYKLGKVTVFDPPKTLEDFNIKTAPQSFRYLDI